MGAHLPEGRVRWGYLLYDLAVTLAAFALLRRMQLLMWALESREHPAFRTTWRDWAREDLGALSAALGA